MPVPKIVRVFWQGLEPVATAFSRVRKGAHSAPGGKRGGTLRNLETADGSAGMSAEVVCPRRVSLLLVSHSYPPVLGGSEIEAQRVCAGLLRRGHSVTVLCAGNKPMPQDSYWIDPAGVPVRIFGKGLRPAWRDWAFAMGVAWTLFRQRRRYQLVYFLMQGLHLAVGLPVAHYLRKSIVMKVSGSSIITLMGRSRAGRLELTCLRKWAQRVMVLNAGIAAEAEAAGLRREQRS